MTNEHGGKILARALKRRGIRRVFSVPGESFLAALDGLYDEGIQNIVCRQEGGAAMMAEAQGKIDDAPGVLFVTRGPGATNASAGLHIAMHDATPMVCFVGQVPLKYRDRGVFQEVNYRAFFGPLVKWVAEVESPDRIEEYIDMAFRIASAGRPGPVVVALPEDVLSAQVEATRPVPLTVRAESGISSNQIDRILAVLEDAKRPMIIVGGSRWDSHTGKQAAEVAGRLGAPIAVTFRRQDLIDNDHPNYAGDLGVGMNSALAKRLSEADAILLAGAELNDITTQDFSLLDRLNPPSIIQVAACAEDLGKHYGCEVGIVATPAQLFSGLHTALPEGPGKDRGAKAARADYKAWQTPAETPGAVKLEQIVSHLREAAPDAIITNGAGNYAAFLHRYHRFHSYGTQLAPTSGSMGYGLPAAIGAKLQNPDKTVICFTGDGCLQMTINELSTAAQYGVEIIVIIANNGRYGTIRMHQENHYPGRVSGTDLFNPDYPTLAQAYGGQGHLVTEADQFAPALEKAMQGGLHLIELRLDPRMLATTRSL